MNAAQTHFEDFKSIVEYIVKKNDWYDANVGYGEDPYQLSFVGTVMALTPSGKFYTVWTSNQNEEDVEADGEFWELVEKWLGEQNLWITEGEGDPCDILICRHMLDHEEGEE